ncbi:glycosyltransferase family 9 protein [Fibrisoma montanum]|uniref:Glycosyltransferase family 9 protein n=1 Tax=Fibrisoma montanum TaxID=2305895 RepID=A0A418LWU0_9BACT|nr:glycosyltransferase family 9 protein [Fibrisoma montanum]RIV17782.1 glycosyltransferase family 9 protein [Fibrisoma montanum]
MQPHNSLPASPQRIAVLRAIKLGDLLCAVPAFRALRQAYPDAHIALIALPWAREFVERYHHLFDEFITFPGWPGLPEQPLDVAKSVAFLQEMQTRQWDLVFQMQGNGTLVNAMLTLFGAKAVVGYHPTNHPERFLPYPELFMPYPDKEHEVKRHVRLMEYVGIPAQGYQLEFPITPQDRAKAGAILTAVGVVLNLETRKPTTSYVCIHAGGVSGRRWPEHRFADVADALAGQGYTIVLTGTTAEEPIIQRVQGLMRHPSVSIAGQTDLGSLAAILDGAAVLISNDTGVSHLAAACHAPSVVIFTSADPAEWAPLDRERHRVVLEKDATTERMLAEVEDLLQTVS